jgi:hypothetical protein
MKRVATVAFAVLALAIPAAVFAGPWYVPGGYMTPGWSFVAENEMFDDGLHGDGAASDGLFGADVVSDQTGRQEFKVALSDWSVSYFGPCNLWVHVNPSETVHFTFDTNAHGDGWLPDQNIVWSDHFAPPGTNFEVIGGAPEIGNWGSGVAADLVGGIWTKTVVIATPGSYEGKFRAVGSWDICNVGIEGAGAPCGANMQFTTVMPNSEVRFEFNTATGRTRVTVGSPVGTEPATWGQVKALYN